LTVFLNFNVMHFLSALNCLKVLPALRMTNRSPGSRWVTNSGTIRLSEQEINSVLVSCSDSRMVPELVTQREPGDLFVIRNAGNIVPSYGPEPGGVSASVEYAVAVLKVRDDIAGITDDK
jgi:hypothetical protein